MKKNYRMKLNVRSPWLKHQSFSIQNTRININNPILDDNNILLWINFKGKRERVWLMSSQREEYKENSL